MKIFKSIKIMPDRDYVWNARLLKDLMRSVTDLQINFEDLEDSVSKKKGKKLKHEKGKSVFSLTCSDCGENVLFTSKDGSVMHDNIVCGGCHGDIELTHKQDIEKLNQKNKKATFAVNEAKKSETKAKDALEKVNKKNEKLEAENKKLKERIKKLENPIAMVSSEHVIL